MATSDNANPAYMFINQNFRSYNRLNYNHWLLKEMCGYMLHPEIGQPSSDARIADVGAGTGIWLFETAATVPKTVQLDGFDASTVNFPPKPWGPENVNLQSHDIFRPFPKEYHDRYDIVHARFPLRLTDDEDFKSLTENLAALLKPQGYLQLFVPNVDGFKRRGDDPSQLKVSVQKLAPPFVLSRPDSSYDWLLHTPQHFETYGFALVAQTSHAMEDHLKLMWAQNNLISGFKDFAPKPTCKSELGDAMAQALNSTHKETSDTPSLHITWTCFVARKVS